MPKIEIKPIAYIETPSEALYNAAKNLRINDVTILSPYNVLQALYHAKREDELDDPRTPEERTLIEICEEALDDGIEEIIVY